MKQEKALAYLFDLYPVRSLRNYLLSSTA